VYEQYHWVKELGRINALKVEVFEHSVPHPIKN